MAEIAIGLVALGMLALKGAAIFALVYVGARLAIRHERHGASQSF